MNIIVGILVATMVGAGAAVAWWFGGPRDRPLDPATPVRVVVGGYVVLYGIGAVALAVAGEATQGPLLIGAAMLAIAVGVIAAGRLVPTGTLTDHPAAALVRGRLRPVPLIGLAAIGLLAAGSLILEFGLPLLTSDAQAARAGWAGPRLDAFRWLVPPAALVAMGIALVVGTRRTAALAACAIGGVLALEVLAASRALPFELGLAAILFAVWAGRQPRLRVWVLIALAGVVIFLGVLFARVAPEGSFTGPLDAAAFAINRTVGRVVLIGPRTIEEVVETFPAEVPFLEGASYTRWLGRLTGAEPSPSLAALLFERLFPDEPPGGFAAPGILGEAYANFGLAWALLLMAGLGVAAVAVGALLRRAPPHIAIRVAIALIVVALLRTYAASLLGTLLTIGAAGAWWAIVAWRPGGREAAAVSPASAPQAR